MTFKKIVLTGLQLAVAMLSSAPRRLPLLRRPNGKSSRHFRSPPRKFWARRQAGRCMSSPDFIPVWKPKGLVYEYDPATDHWTKKKPMALPSHHVAFTEYHGKIYAFGGFVYPPSGPAAWVPINNAWEYDPAADTWKALAPMPSKRGSPVATAVGDKIYVIGGVSLPPGSTDIAVSPTTPQVSVGTVEEYDPETNTWRERSPMPTPRNHAAIGAVNGKIYVIGGRVGAAFIGLASDISVVEEYDPATDKWSATRARMPIDAQRPRIWRDQRAHLRGRRRIPGPAHDGDVQGRRSLRPGQQYMVHHAAHARQQAWTRGRSDRKSLILVGGDVQSSGTGVDVSTSEVDALTIPAGDH